MCGFDGTFEGLSNHNVPEGPSDKPYEPRPKAEFHHLLGILTFFEVPGFLKKVPKKVRSFGFQLF